jgi:hypothetical protein
MVTALPLMPGCGITGSCGHQALVTVLLFQQATQAEPVLSKEHAGFCSRRGNHVVFDKNTSRSKPGVYPYTLRKMKPPRIDRMHRTHRTSRQSHTMGDVQSTVPGVLIPLVQRSQDVRNYDALADFLRKYKVCTPYGYCVRDTRCSQAHRQ